MISPVRGETTLLAHCSLLLCPRLQDVLRKVTKPLTYAGKVGVCARAMANTSPDAQFYQELGKVSLLLLLSRT